MYPLMHSHVSVHLLSQIDLRHIAAGSLPEGINRGQPAEVRRWRAVRVCLHTGLLLQELSYTHRALVNTVRASMLQ